VKYLRKTFNASAIGLTLQRPTPTRPMTLFTLDGEFDNDVFMHKYLTQYCINDPFPYLDLEPDKIYSLEDMMGDGWVESEYYRDLLHPFGYQQMLLIRLSVPNEVDAFLHIGRLTEVGTFDATELEILRQILPDLRHGLRVSSTFKHLEAERLLYENAVETTGIGTILLGAAARVIYNSPAAMALLAQHSALRVCNSRLICTRLTDNRQLNDVITQALDDHSGQFAYALRLFAGELLVVVRAVSYPLSVVDEPGPRVAIFLSERTKRPVLAREVICRLFDLTPAEADLSIKLAEGTSLSEAAIELKISEHTARTYSKRIYSKTGTNRQAELVQLILGSVARVSCHQSGAKHLAYM
jgi:DNA-binding CsgD family transcriptional regulator